MYLKIDSNKGRMEDTLRAKLSNVIRESVDSLCRDGADATNTTIIGLGTRLVHKQNRALTTRMAGTVSSRSSGQVL